MAITGPKDGEPCKANLHFLYALHEIQAGVAIIDLLTGLHAFSGIMAGLLNRERNGVGTLNTRRCATKSSFRAENRM